MTSCSRDSVEVTDSTEARRDSNDVTRDSKSVSAICELFAVDPRSACVDALSSRFANALASFVPTADDPEAFFVIEHADRLLSAIPGTHDRYAEIVCSLWCARAPHDVDTHFVTKYLAAHGLLTEEQVRDEDNLHLHLYALCLDQNVKSCVRRWILETTKLRHESTLVSLPPPTKQHKKRAAVDSVVSYVFFHFVLLS